MSTPAVAIVEPIQRPAVNRLGLPLTVARSWGTGVDAASACRGAIAEPLTDDPEMLAAIDELKASVF